MPARLPTRSFLRTIDRAGKPHDSRFENRGTHEYDRIGGVAAHRNGADETRDHETDIDDPMQRHRNAAVRSERATCHRRIDESDDSDHQRPRRNLGASERQQQQGGDEIVTRLMEKTESFAP